MKAFVFIFVFFRFSSLVFLFIFLFCFIVSAHRSRLSPTKERLVFRAIAQVCPRRAPHTPTAPRSGPREGVTPREKRETLCLCRRVVVVVDEFFFSFTLTFFEKLNPRPSSFFSPFCPSKPLPPDRGDNKKQRRKGNTGLS